MVPGASAGPAAATPSPVVPPPGLDGYSEEVILDRNREAQGKAFYLARSATRHPPGRYLGVAKDTIERYQFMLR